MRSDLYPGIEVGEMRRMAGRFGIAALAVVVCCLAASSESAAQGLPDGYGQCQWGMKPGKAVSIIDKEVNAEGFLMVAMKAHIQKTIEQYKAEHPELEPPSAEEFEDQFSEEDFRKDIFYDELSSFGEKPQFYQELLPTEFEMNAGEGVLEVKDEPRLYYLFANKKLWKVVVVHSQADSAKVSFRDFISKLERRYGSPSRIDYPEGSDPSTGVRPLKAFWETSSTRLEVRPEKNGYREIYVSKAILSNIGAIRKEGKKKFKEM